MKNSMVFLNHDSGRRCFGLEIEEKREASEVEAEVCQGLLEELLPFNPQ